MWILPAVVAAACGSSPASPSAPTLQVGGTYEIRKTVTSDTCGLSSPGDTFTNPAEIRHTAGSTTFVLNDHGTRDLPGTVNTTGAFALANAASIVMNTIPATDAWSNGRFTVQGFEVTDTTDLQSRPGGGAACRIVASWVATKQGAANVIPGP
jgi:hypothetical protein